MKVRDLIAIVEAQGACDAALHWLRKLSPDAPAYLAWQRCPDVEWLVWLLATPHVRAAVGDPTLYWAALDILEDRLPLWDRWCFMEGYKRQSILHNALVAARARDTYRNRGRTVARGQLDRAYTFAIRAMRDNPSDLNYAARDLLSDAAYLLSLLPAYRGEGLCVAHTPHEIRKHIKWSSVRYGLEKAR